MALNNLVELSRRVSLYNGILCTHSSFYPIEPVIRLASTMERDRRFELPQPVWKTGMLTVEHQSRIGNGGRFLEENLRNSKSFIFTCTHNYVLVEGRGLEPPRSFDRQIFLLLYVTIAN